MATPLLPLGRREGTLALKFVGMAHMTGNPFEHLAASATREDVLIAMFAWLARRFGEESPEMALATLAQISQRLDFLPAETLGPEGYSLLLGVVEEAMDGLPDEA